MTQTSGAGTTGDREITAAQWNRTLLHRQHLLERVAEDAIEVLDRCVGMQSQDPLAAFFGMWSRITDFDPLEFDDLLVEREVVRTALLRGTVFAMDAEDARWVRPLAQPTLDAAAARNHGTALVATTAEEVADHAAQLLAGTELAGADLGAQLVQHFPGESASNLTAIARSALPLVQVPPRGTWRGRGAPTYRLFDEWAGPGEPAVTGDDARADLVRLYLRGFGPATIAGIQAWSGLTGLRPLIEAMEADWELTRLRGPDGQELYDLEGLDIIDGDTPAPVRLIAPYDHAIFIAADRERIADPELYRATATPNGRSPGFVLVDGRLVGTWRRAADDSIGVDLLCEISRTAAAQIDAELELLRDFVTG
ncbi:winged helix DNA-binding domain-containing protein [Gordonia sp. ABSL1-1]|uniref:winged helix DNA-binding domain-containing protein n=1 Tax=Gordonia sp. ABSL1-1 TaxID=3053923 RepID=UPI00257258E6|nr:winged helix DNA-binding domain-containing protein [Gordonia sp. ABSL1-1]MDL9937614.1 winged helix DNA-binding domain-containing protein [Gordonia sp. ABSL1-1]